MEIITTVKLAVTVAALLLVCHFVLTAVLGFLVKFSGQLQKMCKNTCIAAGAAYITGLAVAPGYVLELSEPLIRLIGKVAPGFLGI